MSTGWRQTFERGLLTVGLVLAVCSIPFVESSTSSHSEAITITPSDSPSAPDAFSVPMKTDVAAACPDGTSGKRIEALYVHGDAQTSRLPLLRTGFQNDLKQADEAIVRAAKQHSGGVRHLRYVRDARCQVPVVDVTIAQSAMKDVDTITAAIKAQGYGEPDRKYIVWYEANGCGVSFGNGGNDDRGWYNLYNFGPHYATVGTDCWGWAPTLHELLHALGAVQASAPHGTKNGHCWDDEDIMCYDDQSLPKSGLVLRCPKRKGDDIVGNQVDCNGDDYFNTKPAPGSYLDTHWNVADSDYLDRN